MAQPNERFQPFLRKLDDKGIKYAIRECLDNTLMVSYEVLSPRSKHGSAYAYAEFFEKPIYVEQTRRFLTRSDFPALLVDEVLKNDFIIETDSILKARKFADSLPKSMTLVGPENAGKTFACLWVAKKLWKERLIMDAQFVRAVDIRKKRITDEGGNPDWDFSFNRNTDLLVIDDLGTESKVISIFVENSDKANLLYDLVDFRFSHKKPTLITSNMASKEDLAARYGSPFVSRLERWGYIEIIEGNKE